MNKIINSIMTTVCLVTMLSACAPVKWQAPVENQADYLVWPPPPNPARVKYLGEMTAFVPTGESFKTIVFGKGESGKIIKPVAIAVGADGRIAIADTAREGVHLFIPQNQKYLLLSEFAGTKMNSPVSVTFDGDMGLYISDSSLAKVLYFDTDGKFVREITKAGRRNLLRPTGIVYHPQDDRLYLLDTMAHEMHIYSGSGEYISSFGKRGTAFGEFNMPTHIASNQLNAIFVNDAMNFRIQYFSPSDMSGGKFGNHGDGSGDFAMPKGVAVDRAGTIYVAETLFDLIQVFDIDGRYLMSLGSKGTEPGEFWMPSGIFIDRMSKLYVCDTYNNRIQLFQLLFPESEGVQ